MHDRPDAPNPFAPPTLPVAGPPGPPVESAADPGTRTSRFLATVSLIVLFLTTVAIQQIQYLVPTQAPTATPTPEKASPLAPPTDDDPRVIVAKFMLKSAHWMNKQQPNAGAGSADQLAPPAMPPVDRLRNAVLVAEAAGPDAAKGVLEKVKNELAAHAADPLGGVELSEQERDTLAADADTLIALYESGGPLDPTQKDDLQKRHGYFAKVAGVWGLPDADPGRAKLVEGGPQLLIFSAGFGIVAILAVFAGFIVFILAIIKLFTGGLKRRFVPPAPGGSVYLETVAVFFFAFLLLKVGGTLLESSKTLDHQTKTIAALAAQWLLLPLIAWPIFRGVSFTRWRRDIGLHSGSGVLREIAAGITAYLAGIPLLIVGIIVTIAILAIRELVMHAMGRNAPPPPENPILESVRGGGPALWMLVALATIWAPIVEECVFRGCLYRHLRSYVGVVLSAVMTALVFGGAHGYEWLLLGMVIILGFNFSLMREWRGSLIAPITAHFLHNGTIMALVITFFTLLKD